MNSIRISCPSGRAALATAAFFLAASAASAAADSPSGQSASAKPGRVSTLVDLTPSTGETPYSGLVLASDGNFYAVTTAGGAGHHGTVLRITPSGATSVVYSFPRGGDRFIPSAPLVQGSDGALYGLETGDGDNVAIIYRVTLDGQFSQLHTFDDQFPSKLILGRDGVLYGTTVGGGPSGLGQLYRISNDGVLTVIASLDESTPNTPQGPPLEGDDGNFYIAAGGGGSHGFGGLVQVTPSGTVTTLYEFPGTGPLAGPPMGALAYDAAHEYMWGESWDTENVSETVVYRYKAGAVEDVGFLKMLNTGDLALGPDGVHFYLCGRESIYSIAAGKGFRKRATIPGKSRAELIFNSAGVMFGTTVNGGADDGGTIFKVKHF
jgi:uncharacterized repeat protein (TIGR03803 family)